MSSTVAELEMALQVMLGLKPPGVSASRIAGITKLCIDNVQSESVLVQKLFTHFKRVPGPYKLGVLYVVDSVTRKWTDLAKCQGQAISSAARDGTYGAGVHKVTELMPILMDNILSAAPEDQKEKIKKLIDIWDKGQTFPAEMVSQFRDKLNAPRQDPGTTSTTTPPGSPPTKALKALVAQYGGAGPGGSANAAAAPAPASSAPSAMPNIMEALAKIAQQSKWASQSNAQKPPPPPPAPPAPAAFSNPSNGAGLPLMMASNQQAHAQPVTAPHLTMPFGLPAPVTAPAAPVSAAPLGLGAIAGLSAHANAFGNPGTLGAMTAAVSAAPLPTGVAAPVDPRVQQQLALITTLAAQGIPLPQITAIVAQVMGTSAVAPSPLVPAPVAPVALPQPTQTSYSVAAPWETPRPDAAVSRDREPFRDGMRSPEAYLGGRGRSRSRSPLRNQKDARLSPTRVDYGGRGANSPSRGRSDDRDRDLWDNRGRGRPADPYRQRSPPRRQPSSDDHEPSQHEKWIEYDNSIPHGCIKVFSRTLFVGGVTCSESELRQTFGRHGKVQTCIVNKDKRHAFVKMYFRKDAENAKKAMEENRNSDMQLRTRWGVGFGPRDCSDYQTGVSVIPIHKLTEADRKWMVTAPFGGSGGRNIVTGLCVEEPDIEIGAGVSSKAISRRMQTDKGGHHGPKSTRRDDEQTSGGGGGGGLHGGGHGIGSDNSPATGVNAANSGGNRWRRGRDNHRGGAGVGVSVGGDLRRSDDRYMRSTNEEPVVVGLPPGFIMGPNGPSLNTGYTYGA